MSKTLFLLNPTATHSREDVGAPADGLGGRDQTLAATHSREDVGAPADGLGGRDQTLRPAVVLLVELLRRRCALSKHTPAHVQYTV